MEYVNLGTTGLNAALAWLLHQRGITAPIAGASKLEHIEAAVKAVALSLSKEEIGRLSKPYVPHPVLGHG